MAYRWEKVARAVWAARARARLGRGEFAAVAGVEVCVVEQLEAVCRRGRRSLLGQRYAQVAGVERVLGFPDGRVRAIALGFIDPAAAA